jgi:long-chain fatty acid transport protein
MVKSSFRLFASMDAFSFLTFSFLFFGYSPTSYGAAYQSSTTSAIGLGSAYAGEAAATDNIANIAANPALTATFQSPRIAIGGILVNPNQDVDGIAYSNGDPSSLDSNGIADDYIVPAGYFTYPLTEDWSFGLAMFSDYNFRYSYKPRYPIGINTGQRSLFTYEMNPQLAMHYSEDLYFGFGVSSIYANYKLTTRYGDQHNPNPSQIYQDYQGSGLGFRYNLGLLYLYGDSTQIGLAYRSASEIKMEGILKTTATDNQGSFNDTATLTTTVPEEIQLSAVHQLNSTLSIQSSLAWHNWGNLTDLSITHTDCPDNPSLNLPSGQCLKEKSNGKESWRIALAVNYQLNNAVIVRSGIATEQTSESSTIAMPFDNQNWFSLGLTYQATPKISFDMGIAYLTYEDITIAGSNYQVKAHGSNTLLGLQLSYRLIN